MQNMPRLQALPLPYLSVSVYSFITVAFFKIIIVIVVIINVGGSYDADGVKHRTILNRNQGNH